MKFFNLSGEKSADGKRSVVNRTLSNLVPSAARAALESQEAVIQVFKKILDNLFHLFQGLRFTGMDEPGPLLLIGPAGIWLVEATPLSGIFRASGEQLDEMDAKAQTFRPARLNIMRKAQAATAAMQAVVDEWEAQLPRVESVVLFTHPGAHIEAQQPAVRLIQADAIARFAAGLLQIRPVLEPETVARLSDRLNPPDSATSPEPFEVLPAPEKPAPPPSLKLPDIPEDEPELVRRISRRLSFSRYQWWVIALLFILNLLVLVGAIVIILIIT